MEKKRNDIDNLFRKNLSDYELPEKNGNWELLNHLLNEQEQKKKKRKWLLFGFCFLVIISSDLMLILPGDKPKQNTTNKTEFPDLTITENIPNQPVEKKIHAGNVENSIKAGNNLAAGEEKNNNHNFETVRVAGSAVVSQNNNSAPVSTPSGNNFNADGQDVHVDDNTTLVETTVPPGLNIEETSPANNSLGEATTENQHSASADSSGIEIIINDSSDSLTENSLPAATETNEHLPVKSNHINFNLLAGATFYSTGGSFSDDINIAPVPGLEFLYIIDSSFSIGLAGLYSLQGGYNLVDSVIGVQETYFLDKEVNVYSQSIQIRQLHKLYFPVTLYYSFAKRHFISGAIQCSYLLNTSGNYSETNTISGVSTTIRKNKAKGYMDGIKSTNVSISLGYKYFLSTRFDVSARVTKDLTENYVKDYFKGVNANPSWSVQTFLVIKF